MPIDLDKFREANINYYGDSSLRDVASDIYARYRLDQHGYATPNDWIKDQGMEDQIKEDDYRIRQIENQKIARKNLETRGDIKRGFIRVYKPFLCIFVIKSKKFLTSYFL